MEKFPGGNVEVIDASGDVEVVDVPFDEKEQAVDQNVYVDDREKNAGNGQLFLEQLELGEDNYKAISGEDDTSVLNPEQKLFFSAIDPSERVELSDSKSVDLPVLTLYGIRVGKDLVGFDRDYLGSVMGFLADKYMKESHSQVDFYRVVESSGDDWRSTFISERVKGFVEDTKKPFEEQKKKYETQVDGRYLQNSIDSYLIDELSERYPGKSEDDYKDMSSSIKLYRREMARVKTMVADGTDKAITNNYIKQAEDSLKVVLDAKKVDLDANEVYDKASEQYKNDFEAFLKNGYLSEEELADCKAFPRAESIVMRKIAPSNQGELREKLRKLKNAIKIEAQAVMREKFGDDIEFKALKNDYDVNAATKEIIGREEALERLKKSCEEQYGLGSFEAIKEFEQACDHYYFDLAHKYRFGAVKWGRTPGYARDEIAEKKAEINAEEKMAVEDVRKKHGNKRMIEIENKLAQDLFGIEDVKRAYFTPAGCFVCDKDGGCSSYAVSPFDKRVAALLDPDDRSAWQSAWRKERAKVLERDSLPSGFSEFVSGQFRSIMLDNQSLIPEGKYKKLNDLAVNYGFRVPDLFSRFGVMNRLPSEHEIDALGDMIKPVSRYVDSVNFDPTTTRADRIVTLKGISAAITDFIADGHNDIEITHLFDTRSGGNLNFFSYQSVLNECDGDTGKANDVVYSCIAYGLYRSLKKDQIREFSDLLGPKANVSRQSVYFHFGKRIDSPYERRGYAVRAQFITEFLKYVHGKSEQGYRGYFDKIHGVE